MAIRKLEPSEWTGFCIRASRSFIGTRVEIEVTSLQIGHQPQARQLPLQRMAYDPQNDVLELLVGEVDHLIRAPRELYVDETPTDTAYLAYLQIIDADGVRQIVTLREPLMLPSPR